MASRPERCAGLAPPPSLLGFWEMAWRARSSSASCVSSFAWPTCGRPFLGIAGQMGPLLLRLRPPSPVLVCCSKIGEGSRRGAAQPASSCSNAVLHSPSQFAGAAQPGPSTMLPLSLFAWNCFMCSGDATVTARQRQDSCICCFGLSKIHSFGGCSRRTWRRKCCGRSRL